jgi:sugar phosphate isomerase/epimerase
MRDLSQHLELLSLNTGTVRKQASLDQIIEAAVARGIGLIDPWRDQVQAIGLDKVARHMRDAGVRLSGYCRGGFYTGANAKELAAALDDNRRAIDEAKALGSPCLVLVVGSLPGALLGKPQSIDITLARSQVRDGIAASLDYARSAGMPLAIEPLHPMQAAERACVNTLEQALDLCDELDPGRTGALGVALDAYHVWWDPKLAAQIRRASVGRLLAYHICDWLVPTRDLLNDRGMPGDGVIELKKLRSLVEAAGYQGAVEIEIFSEAWWSRPLEEVLDICISRYKSIA